MSNNRKKTQKNAFTLVELLIVVSIMGILAAIVLPEFQNHSQQAKESVAKDNLRILRISLERYRLDHNGISPGYAGWLIGSGPVLEVAFHMALLNNNNSPKKAYIDKRVENPFNNKTTILMIANGATFPATATGNYGWVYQPSTNIIKLDWPGTDPTGKAYFDY